MRFIARVFLQSTLLLAVVGGFLVSDAFAVSQNVITVTYGGSVKTVSSQMVTDTGVVVGDPIPIAAGSMFSYNANQLGSGGLYTFTGAQSTNTHTFNVFIYNSGGTQQFMDSFTNNAAPPANYFAIKMTAPSGSTPAEMQIMGDTTYKQGSGLTHSGTPSTVAYDLILKNPSYMGTAPPALPNSAAAINAFLTTPGTLIWDPPGDKFTASIDNFNGQTVPEPSGLVLALSAMAVCTAGFLISRRKAAAVSASGPIA